MRYIIGIDLGTTNCCVSYVDMLNDSSALQFFRIPQFVSEGRIEALATLPSFCYLPGKEEVSEMLSKLPWQRDAHFYTGHLAQTLGAKVPTRLVQSAKSWLCHPAVNRRDKILPVISADENTRISPVEASARYLDHIRAAWNQYMSKGKVEDEFEQQDVILTVPASFDEVARALTVEAAKMAGIGHLTLLEEPQAAFYSWLAQHSQSNMLENGSCVLVCDVGGGTTDFSLIECSLVNGVMHYQRMAVGDHLLLGGDNMDAAIAHLAAATLSTQELDTTQRLQLLHEARRAKEMLLPTDSEKTVAESTRIILQTSGSNVIQGTIALEVQQHQLRDLLLKGFFGIYAWDEALKVRKKSGIRSMGLPYEEEPSITKHLASFLAANAPQNEKAKKPDFILFNGGTMKSRAFRAAVLESLNQWFPEKNIRTLPSYNLDLAVARGAAYYGLARRGLGIKIAGGTARGYYLGVETRRQQGDSASKALCLLPRGSGDGSVYEPSTTFMLTPNVPVAFRLYTSHTRLHDQSGELIDIDPQEMHALPQISTVLRFGKRQELSLEKIPVHIRILLTEMGTIEISLHSQKSEHVWMLEFQIRGAEKQDIDLSEQKMPSGDQTFHAGYLKSAEMIIQQIFAANSSVKPNQLMDKLESELSLPRREWPPSVLRALAEQTLKCSGQRKVSSDHHARWWNAIGFFLRPGFGYPLDDFRIKELWKIILNDSKSQIQPEVAIQMWICYRRIAGGLNKGQQMQVAGEIVNTVLAKKQDLIELKSKSEAYSLSEKIRALAAMELLEIPLKIRLGNALVERICKQESAAADYWALGRIGARHLLYGSLVNVVANTVCVGWIEKLLSVQSPLDEKWAFLFGQLARKTQYGEINIPHEICAKIKMKFASTEYAEHLNAILSHYNQFNELEQSQAFGEFLPAALLMES